jgi:hypothetical protein
MKVGKEFEPDQSASQERLGSRVMQHVKVEATPLKQRSHRRQSLLHNSTEKWTVESVR